MNWADELQALSQRQTELNLLELLRKAKELEQEVNCNLPSPFLCQSCFRRKERFYGATIVVAQVRDENLSLHIQIEICNLMRTVLQDIQANRNLSPETLAKLENLQQEVRREIALRK